MKNPDMLWVVASFAVLGTMLALWIRTLITRRQARNWPMNEGTVESATIALKTRGGEPGTARHGTWRRSPIPMQSPEIGTQATSSVSS